MTNQKFMGLNLSTTRRPLQWDPQLISCRNVNVNVLWLCKSLWMRASAKRRGETLENYSASVGHNLYTTSEGRSFTYISSDNRKHHFHKSDFSLLTNPTAGFTDRMRSLEALAHMLTNLANVVLHTGLQLFFSFHSIIRSIICFS